jgi:hypothetical protein
VPGYRYAALAKLVGLLEDPDREAAVDEILDAASEMAVESPGAFRRALGDIVKWMSPGQVDTAFGIAQSVLADTAYAPAADYAGMLHHLAGRLSREQLREARVPAEQIGDPRVRVPALAALASSGAFPARTQRALIGQILRLSYSIADDGQRAEALVLAASVPGADRPQVLGYALATANSVAEDNERAKLLCGLLTILPPERALEAFGETLKASLGRRESGSFGGNPFYEGLGRPFLLTMLEEAAPWFGTLDEPLLVSHVVQSVRDVARWWP